MPPSPSSAVVTARRWSPMFDFHLSSRFAVDHFAPDRGRLITNPRCDVRKAPSRSFG
jgi:hypothetical protein